MRPLLCARVLCVSRAENSAPRHIQVERLVEQLIEREVPLTQILGRLAARPHFELDQAEEMVGVLQRVTDPAQVVNRAADPDYAGKVLDYAQRMLAWRMTHTERTLTGMKLTHHAGVVERRAPRR